MRCRHAHLLALSRSEDVQEMPISRGGLARASSFGSEFFFNPVSLSRVVEGFPALSVTNLILLSTSHRRRGPGFR
jgi:hypothetical protein